MFSSNCGAVEFHFAFQIAATYLVKFVATDQDTGDAGVVKYTKVLGLKNSSLTLHPDSGILSIATDSHGFDREESSSKSQYVFY